MKNFINVFLVCIAITCFVHANEELLVPQNEEEALFLRRIVEFHKDQEHDLVRSQIEEYVKKYPQGIFSDGLKAFLADLYLEEEKYEIASGLYAHIKNETVLSKITLNYIQSLYKLENFKEIVEKFSPYIEGQEQTDLALFLYADSLYRIALTTEDLSKKTTYLEDSAKYFEKTKKTSYYTDALKPLAHVYYLLDLKPKAAKTYLLLAEKDPLNKEEHLFQAANLQTEFDKDQAIQTFSQISHIGKRYTCAAALNKLLLLFETEKFAQIILLKERFAKDLAPEDSFLLPFFLGQSYFFTKNFDRAEKELTTYVLKHQDNDPERKKSALCSLLEIAKNNENFALFETSISHFSKLFPKNENLLNAYFARALIYKKHEDYKNAEKDFLTILEQPHFDKQKENVMFEYAHMLYLSDRFQDARKYFQTWLHTFQGHSLTPLVWRYLIQSSVAYVQKNPKDAEAKEKLIFELDSFLTHPNLATKKELIDYTYLLAQTNYSLKDLDETILLLDELLSKDLSEKMQSKCHFLIAMSYKEKGKSLYKFCEHAEKALHLNPQINEKEKLRLNLFNAYLFLSEKKPEFIQNAARHLYTAFVNKEPLQEENIFWLANFYFQKAKTDPSFTKYAVFVYETILTKEKIEENAYKLEEAILNLAEIYYLEKQHPSCVALLENLEKEYTKAPELKWKYPELVYFYLAKDYEKQKIVEKAILFYEQVFVHSNNFKDPILAEACLSSCRLRISYLPVDLIVKSNHEVIKVLTRLKDLIIQKNLPNEPLHLQAALEYVDLQTQLFGKKDISKRQFFLKKIQDNFLLDSTVIGKEYKKNKKHLKDKSQIFETYMNYINTEIAFCQMILDKNIELKQELVSSLEVLLKNPCMDKKLHLRITGLLDKISETQITK